MASRRHGFFDEKSSGWRQLPTTTRRNLGTWRGANTRPRNPNPNPNPNPNLSALEASCCSLLLHTFIRRDIIVAHAHIFLKVGDKPLGVVGIELPTTNPKNHILYHPSTTRHETQHETGGRAACSIKLIKNLSLTHRPLRDIA